MLTSSSADKKQPRDSSLELLRIIAMVMIIFHHFAVHGGFEWEETSITIPHLWYNFISMGGKVGVDIFILISGYFLCVTDVRSFNFKRILKFWGEVFFYSFTSFLIFKLTGNTDLDVGIKMAIKSAFPITFSGYWFPSAYFALYLIHPFLNKLLNVLDKKTYQNLVVLVVICWSVIPTFTTSSFQGNSLLWFICLYIIAGYVRIFGLNTNFKREHYFAMWLTFTLVTYASSFVFTILGMKWSIFATHSGYFYGQEKITTLLISLSLFMVFVNIKMKYRKWINTIATATFGVYLIHDNYYVRPFIWKTLFKNSSYQNSLMLIPYSVLVVIIVYTCCTLLDLGRKQFVEKPFMIVVDKDADRFLKPFKSIVDFFKNIVFGNQ